MASLTATASGSTSFIIRFDQAQGPYSYPTASQQQQQQGQQKQKQQQQQPEQQQKQQQQRQLPPSAAEEVAAAAAMAIVAGCCFAAPRGLQLKWTYHNARDVVAVTFRDH